MVQCVAGLAEEITPYYSYAHLVKASINITNGRAYSRGSLCPEHDEATRVVVKLQQNIGGTWRTIGEWIGSSSSGIAEAGGSEEIDQGFSYRTYTYGTIYDANGNILETVTEYSDITNY